MTANHKTNILFDDFLMLTELANQKEFTFSPSAIDCDCTSHTSPSDNQDVNTDQVAPSAGQAH